LIGFGHSLRDRIRNETAGYTAPEILEKGIATEKSDIFSCGIILYYMLSGKIPYASINSVEIENEINYDELKKLGVSEKAIELIKTLTNSDPDKRPTASKALQNKWILEAMEIKEDSTKSEICFTPRFKTEVTLKSSINNF